VGFGRENFLIKIAIIETTDLNYLNANKI
jgi:hypothetical protein